MTASAKAVATAASTAVPPAAITSAPMRDAISFCDATMPFWARIGTELAPVASVSATQIAAASIRRACVMESSVRGLYAFQLPGPSSEQPGAHHRHHGKRDRHRREDARRSVAERAAEEVRQRDLEQPEAAEVDQRRCPRVAGAVERLRQDVAGGVERKAAADDAKAE